jgi:hypothetical protein
MKSLRFAAAAAFALAASAAHADSLVAVSNTAMSITGDIEFDDFEIVFANGEKLVFSELVGDTFVVEGREVPASVYEIEEPADPALENGNRLCGSGDVTYLASWAGSEDSTIIAVFTTPDVPGSDAEMCASYTYAYP